ncbi:restriction endonuclease subunit S [Curtobacterium flaccumfaciens]|nr:restriction endonuclease subunit S [Curtobacterium flaccumfaciens]
MAKTNNNANRKLVLKGDFAINSRSDRKGSAGMSGLDGSVSVITTVLQPRGLNPRFTHHLLRSRPFQEEFYRWGHGIVDDLWSTKWSDMKSIKIPVPPEPEQRAIADYLDRETAQIDAFIAKNEELITLLTERRAATITYALTSGLDDSAGGQDEPRIGAIPARWEVMPLRYLLRRIEQGVSPQAESGLAEGDNQFGVLKAGCVNGGVYRPTEHKLLPAGFDFDRSLLVRPGDLLINRASGSVQLLGSAAIATESAYRLILSDKTFRIVPTARTSRNYLYWLLNSRMYREQVEASVSGADGLANNLSQANLRRFMVPVPTQKEQEQISFHLKDRCAKIDRSIATARRSVSLAQERRAALISAAVTGKINVGVAA